MGLHEWGLTGHIIFDHINLPFLSKHLDVAMLLS